MSDVCVCEVLQTGCVIFSLCAYMLQVYEDVYSFNNAFYCRTVYQEIKLFILIIFDCFI